MNFSGTLRLNKFSCFILILIIFLILYFSNGNSKTGDSSDFVNLKSLLKAAIYAAERGGRRVVEGSKINLNTQSKGKTREGANDPVTDADFASHCAMYYGFRKTFPKLTVISEEHSKDVDGCSNQELLPTEEIPLAHESIYYLQDEHVHLKDVTIWIDPLDATQEFTEGLYQYVTTMVCVAVKGVPVIGVIHYPFSAPHTYWGWLLKLTSDNIQKLANPQNADTPRVIVSRSHPGEVTKTATDIFGPQTKISSAAGAGYKVMTVANGTQDIYFHTTYIKKWDICAGDAIINTLGGAVTTLKGMRIDYSADSDVKVKDGLLVARFDHSKYLSQVQKSMDIEHR